MGEHAISVIKVRETLMITVPPEPDDSTVSALQERVLNAMERHDARAVMLDISAVETLDSFFARTVSETARMVTLMGGRTIIVGMRPAVAMTATLIGITLNGIETALTVERALGLVEGTPPPRPRR
jgi:rsbT antagonist protein RsbS